MAKPSNDERADRAQAGLMAFASAAGLRSEYNYEELDTIISDFLIDLRHLCRRDGIDIELKLISSEVNYEEEVASEAESDEEE